MRSYTMNRKGFCAFIFAIGLFSCVTCHADRGGGGGAFNNGGYDHNDTYNNNGNFNNDNHDGYYEGGVEVGAPGAVYLVPSSPTTCSTVQQCDSDGNCMQNQVCN